MTRMKIGVPVFSCLLLLISANRVEAGVVTWEIEGSIAIVADPQNVLQGQIMVGSPFFLEFAYDSLVPNTNTIDEPLGLYVDAIVTYTGSIGSLPFASVTGINEIVSGDSRIRSIFNAQSSIILQGDIMVSSIAMTGPLGLFPQDMLPLVPPGDSFLSVGDIFEIFDSSQSLLVSANITRIVPEPTTLVLLSLSTLAGAFVHRRNKKISKL